jgi:NADPH:quinone reductase-like Zn-dependent oxidoreductase
VIQNVANSGVGTYLVQLAKRRGLRTVNLVRRESAVAATKAQGGDVVLVDGERLADRVNEATGGAAIRLGIDAVGGAGYRPAGAMPERRWHAGQLRHDERRALPGRGTFIHLP